MSSVGRGLDNGSSGGCGVPASSLLVAVLLEASLSSDAVMRSMGCRRPRPRAMGPRNVPLLLDWAGADASTRGGGGGGGGRPSDGPLDDDDVEEEEDGCVDMASTLANGALLGLAVDAIARATAAGVLGGGGATPGGGGGARGCAGGSTPGGGGGARCCEAAVPAGVVEEGHCGAGARLKPTCCDCRGVGGGAAGGNPSTVSASMTTSSSSKPSSSSSSSSLSLSSSPPPLPVELAAAAAAAARGDAGGVAPVRVTRSDLTDSTATRSTPRMPRDKPRAGRPGRGPFAAGDGVRAASDSSGLAARALEDGVAVSVVPSSDLDTKFTMSCFTKEVSEHSWCLGVLLHADTPGLGILGTNRWWTAPVVDTGTGTVAVDCTHAPHTW